jgi:hypothetical protein
MSHQNDDNKDGTHDFGWLAGLKNKSSFNQSFPVGSY